MLELLRNRCEATEPRLRTHHADALAFAASPATTTYDLVVTHFFLDCLTQPQLETLATALIPKLKPNALWLISDFRIPPGPMRLPAKLFVRSLYLAFRSLTGLCTTQLPDHSAALARIGLKQIAVRNSLGGLLTTQLWKHSSSSIARRPVL